jgi:hypothetical protein
MLRRDFQTKVVLDYVIYCHFRHFLFVAENVVVVQVRRLLDAFKLRVYGLLLLQELLVVAAMLHCI